MPEYAWMYLYKHDSDYALGPKYDKILNMAGFSICERYTVFWIYALAEFWIYVRF